MHEVNLMKRYIRANYSKSISDAMRSCVGDYTDPIDIVRQLKQHTFDVAGELEYAEAFNYAFEHLPDYGAEMQLVGTDRYGDRKWKIYPTIDGGHWPMNAQFRAIPVRIQKNDEGYYIDG